jgi:hypothetical protein
MTKLEELEQIRNQVLEMGNEDDFIMNPELVDERFWILDKIDQAEEILRKHKYLDRGGKQEQR